jgi:hypothetical protein
MLPNSWVEQHFKGVRFEGEEAAALCPFHKERKPSFYLNLRTGAWKCHAGCGGGGLKGLCKKLSLPLPAVGKVKEAPVEDKERQYIGLDRVADDEKRLWSREGRDALNYLKKRGITTEVLKRFRIGYSGTRVQIPILLADGSCVNIRQYDWTHVDQHKFLSVKTGLGDAVLWPGGVVEANDELIVFEGELDTLLAHSLGLAGAVTGTGGAGTWSDAWTRAMAHKRVLVCYDIDDAGRQGAALVAKKLLLAAESVRVVALPISEPPHGDFTDFAAAVKLDRKEVHGLFAKYRAMAGTEQRVHFSRLSEEAPDESKLLQLRAVVSGKDLTPFNVPAAVAITCVPDDKGKSCSLCPLKAFGGTAQIDIPVTSKVVLQSVQANDSAVDRAVRDYCGVPSRCPGCRADINKTISLWDVRLSPDVDSGEEEGAEGARRAFSMKNLITNQPYDMKLAHVSDPKTQYSLLHILQAKTSHTSLDAWSTVGKEELLKLWEAK